MKTNKLIPLILTAALALSACASAADSATTAAPAETAAATPEPTAAPEPVGAARPCRNWAEQIRQCDLSDPSRPLTMRATLLEPSFYKTDPDARQTTALYEYNDSAYSTLYQFLANDTLYVVMYRYDSDTKLLAVPLDGGEVWEFRLAPTHGVPSCMMTAMSTVCLTAKRRPLPPVDAP